MFIILVQILTLIINSESYLTVGSQKKLCEDLIIMGRKLQDLSERVANIDKGQSNKLLKF